MRGPACCWLPHRLTKGFGKTSTGGFQYQRGRPAAESAGGTSDLRRCNWHGDRHADRRQVIGGCPDAGAGMLLAPPHRTTKGFDKIYPVASNNNVEGRQRNRRVELVISGEVIGTGVGTPILAR